ncbi:hypothetical protein GFY24_30210 [Nocardia sp. SYP-A9097]|uniref:hypothetical protein n=1 Tax=Nocardia sp. SYP-A9097 TaxID=2663237 RepID=UPI00129B87CB|nr:hypothetical protein [Nocardia sp. SYP-A9097]MRH91664.1 hypothetical protein [Nocardia sp. SYP-A9097]
MSDTARNDPRIVRQLAQFLDRYLREAESGERTAGFAQRRVEAELAQQIAKRQRELASAKQEYESCCRIEDADCSGPRRVLERCVRALDAAHRAQRMYDASTAEYISAAARFARVRVSLATESKQLLATIADDLDAYGRATAAASSVTFASGGASTRIHGTAASTPSLSHPPGFPAGYAMVPVGALDTSGSNVGGPGSFKSDSTPDDLEWGFETFNSVIVRALRQGKGLDYFRERDSNEGLCGTRSYAMTYTGFLADDEAVRVRLRPDGTFEVRNGFHRIWVAQRMGLADIPAKVVD